MPHVPLCWCHMGVCRCGCCCRVCHAVHRAASVPCLCWCKARCFDPILATPTLDSACCRCGTAAARASCDMMPPALAQVRHRCSLAGVCAALVASFRLSLKKWLSECPAIACVLAVTRRSSCTHTRLWCNTHWPRRCDGVCGREPPYRGCAAPAAQEQQRSAGGRRCVCASLAGSESAVCVKQSCGWLLRCYCCGEASGGVPE